jgi:hypothetical protein
LVFSCRLLTALRGEFQDAVAVLVGCSHRQNAQKLPGIIWSGVRYRSRNSASVIDFGLRYLIIEQGVSAISTASAVRSTPDRRSIASRARKLSSFNEPNTLRLAVAPSPNCNMVVHFPLDETLLYANAF